MLPSAEESRNRITKTCSVVEYDALINVWISHHEFAGLTRDDFTKLYVHIKSMFSTATPKGFDTDRYLNVPELIGLGLLPVGMCHWFFNHKYIPVSVLYSVIYPVWFQTWATMQVMINFYPQDVLLKTQQQRIVRLLLHYTRILSKNAKTHVLIHGDRTTPNILTLAASFGHQSAQFYDLCITELLVDPFHRCDGKMCVFEKLLKWSGYLFLSCGGDSVDPAIVEVLQKVVAFHRTSLQMYLLKSGLNKQAGVMQFLHTHCGLPKKVNVKRSTK